MKKKIIFNVIIQLNYIQFINVINVNLHPEKQ